MSFIDLFLEELLLQLLMILDCRDADSCKGAKYVLHVDDGTGDGMVILVFSSGMENVLVLLCSPIEYSM
jgi:hypothetical protein